MTIRIYTLWAALKEDQEAFWMIDACDEFSWEGRDDQDAAWERTKKKGEAEGWIVREVVFLVDSANIDRAFQPPEVELSEALDV